ncbi:MAG: 4-phosphoerythronate dehydrogenase [Porphyromonadaceae bacterium]|nr:MAG: 4-phosphoerythronate dehydrogenase [Porphyromonadaceae bacterium]
MKIVIDDRIPFIRGVFEPHSEVLYLPGGQISREHLRDTGCLLVRTRTRCDQKLLEGTRVKFIATATIGFDHIDTKWCEENGISWTNAPGCNSGAVAQYVTAALHEMANRLGFDLKDKILGIIGVGYVGKKVEKIARELGMQVILNDPPRVRSEGLTGFTDLKNLLAHSDIISLHIPLNREGQDKTYQMVDREFQEALKPGAILINSSRGEVMEESEVVRALRELRTLRGLRGVELVLDVWNNEPHINRELLNLTSIATPHIAGYSVEGKYNATKMVVEAVSEYFQLSMTSLPSLTKKGVVIRQNGSVAAYDIMADDRRLRESPETFEQQRNKYPERWESNPDKNHQL